jgi:2-polyprenyl-3-methyl-5-hydroxy-6-metoxy-1,4-benzoquinol methylase
MRRRVEPEILDGLPADDPEAVRSRRDLRRINVLMGNLAWMQRAMRMLPEGCAGRLVEIGAGEGELLERVRNDFESVRGVDLAPRPAGLSAEIGWIQGDVFEYLGEGDVLAANLFLHHFEDERLRELGERMQEFKALCFSEPRRSRRAILEGYALVPFVNRVTRHDMMVSVRAGFVRGELRELLGLGAGWEVREEVSLLGACRLLAWRAD